MGEQCWCVHSNSGLFVGAGLLVKRARSDSLQKRPRWYVSRPQLQILGPPAPVSGLRQSLYCVALVVSQKSCARNQTRIGFYLMLKMGHLYVLATTTFHVPSSIFPRGPYTSQMKVKQEFQRLGTTSIPSHLYPRKAWLLQGRLRPGRQQGLFIFGFVQQVLYSWSEGLSSSSDPLPNSLFMGFPRFIAVRFNHCAEHC